MGMNCHEKRASPRPRENLMAFIAAHKGSVVPVTDD
jgi:hypothetical protein